MTSNYIVSVHKLEMRENELLWVGFCHREFPSLVGNVGFYQERSPRKDLESGHDAKSKTKLILTIGLSLHLHIKEVNSTNREIS